MMPRSSFPDRLNSYLACLLGLGSWVSCLVIVTGLVLPILDIGTRSGGSNLVSIGIAVLIALPTLRVATMGVWFLVHRNFDFALIAGLVLVIILVSTLLGTGAGSIQPD